MRERNRWPDWLNLAAGAWIFVSPWVLGYTGDTASEWTAWILGAAVAAIAAIALVARESALDEGFGVLAGVVLFVAPWLFGYSGVGDAATNSWLFGVVVTLLALSGFGESRRVERAHHAGHAHGAHA